MFFICVNKKLIYGSAERGQDLHDLEGGYD